MMDNWPYQPNPDILRIRAFWQFYGYKTNITAFFEIRKYRLVGDIAASLIGHSNKNIVISRSILES